MKNTAINLTVFCACFALGFYFLNSNVEHFSISRDPAAVRSTFDFSHLKGDPLVEAVKARMISGFQLAKEADRIGLSLGHFAFINQLGNKTLACKEYEKVILSFEAEGVLVSGERPSMVLEGSCRFSEDLSRIRPLYLPVARILGERPADGEFNFRDENPVVVRFSNLSDEWPRQWLLTSVSLQGTKEKILIERNELRRLIGQPMVLNIGAE